MKIKLQIVYEDELKVYGKILFFKKDFSSSSSKNFDFKKLTGKFGNKNDNTQTDSDDSEESTPILQKLDSIKNILTILFDTFRKHLHIKIAKIHIRVATKDAAKTALLYGAVSTAVACILDVVDSITNLDRLKKSSISVEPDFLSDKTDIKLNIVLRISVLGVIKVFMKSFLKYFSLNDKTQINNRKEK